MILSALVLSGCLGGDTAFSRASQIKGNSLCGDLFNSPAIVSLQANMPILPGEIPTREMLYINLVPTPSEAKAIQSLEGAIRTCRLRRAAQGIPTSATEDIVEKRLSRLRYGLYNGDIPYAVYNYGLAQALKEQSKFRLSVNPTYAKSADEGALFTGINTPTQGTMSWNCTTLNRGVACN
ncbi:MAG: hypothetical protein OQK24_03395 [Magnetovibrio sp.]|nr:hypothetical protein [Magnetovibrio sp.]